MQGKVEICGVNTSALRTLEAGETMELLCRAQSGDREENAARRHHLRR